MVNDGEEIVADMKLKVRLDAGLLDSASTGVRQDISSFLAKPIPLSYGQFTSSDTPGSFTRFNLFDTLMGKDIYKRKVSGHMGIRATTVLRIQFNAERFMQGKYLMAFLPFTARFTDNDAQRAKQMVFNKTTVTQLPHVEFDLNCDTEAVLRIPFVSPYSHYDLVSVNSNDIGSVLIYPYSPLRVGSAGSTICQYTLWASLEDVELVAPTLPQMGKSGGSMRPAASVKKRGTVTELEQKSQGVGPIESVLNAVSRAADVVSQVPIISAVSSQVSWAAHIASRAAHVFGWSKPMDLDGAMRMHHTFAPFLGNADTVDKSMPVSLISTNAVETLPGFAGTDIDETSIDYIKTIPAHYQTILWNKSDVTDQVLFTSNLKPTTYQNTHTGDLGEFYTMTPVAWIGSMFKYYRGSIRLRFKVVKTEFHSGRLLLSYHPAQTPKSGSVSILDTTYLHREVLDIRMGSEFSFVIPYASLQSYREASSEYGRVQLTVLNELVSPDTVSPSVEILVEASGAPDLEFACPTLPNYEGYVPSVQQMFAPTEFQMDSGKPCVIDEGILSNGAIFDDGLSAARFCVGEKVMSLTQLLKVSCFSEMQGESTGNLSIFPYSVYVRSPDGTDYAKGGPTDVLDWYDYIAPSFALCRGGYRIKALNVSGGIVAARLCPVNLNTVAYRKYDKAFPAQYCDFTLANYSGMLGQYYDVGSAPLEVQVPQYHKFHSRYVTDGFLRGNCRIDVGPNAERTTPSHCLWLQCKGGEFVEGQTLLSRSVADDFQLGYFTGVPPMMRV